MPLEDYPISEKIISLLHLNHGDKRCITRYGIVFFASMSLKGNSTQKTNRLQMKGLIVNSSDTKFDDSTHLC